MSRLAAGVKSVGAESELAGVEVDRPVGEWIGDAGRAVAGRAAGGDRVEDRARGVGVAEAQRLAGRDDGRAGGGAAAQEVALAVEEVGDRERIGGGGRAVGQRARVGQSARAAAMVVVLLQVPVREPAAPLERAGERVDAAARAGAKATGMIPIDSYQDARLAS